MSLTNPNRPACRLGEPASELTRRLIEDGLKPATAHADAKLSAFIREQEARLGQGVEAIAFAVQIDDHYDRLEFLNAWLEGRCFDSWPEFDARTADCKPLDDDEAEAADAA